jgi:hypothetical protein
MEEKKKWAKLPKKQKTAEELNKFYRHTPLEEKRLLILVGSELRNFGLEQIIWARNEDASGLGLFESSCPQEEADRIVWKLRQFGYLPEAPEATEEEPK